MKKNRQNNLLIFFLLTVLVIFIQYDLLRPALDIGLTPDDWSFIFWYKLLGPDPWSKVAEVWSVRGPYTTVPLYYTGFIHSLVGFDYQRIQFIGILFKTLATLVVFPLSFIVFQNRLFAFFATILFAMAYPASGALETAVEPSEYLGMFSMGIFLITYYHIVKNNLLNWKWLSLITSLLIITVLLSVMRSYPILVLIPLVEIYLLVRKRSIAALRTFFLRISILFSPFILITLFHPGVILSYIGVVPTVLLKVLEGNWHLALTPFQGIGHIIPLSAYWGKIFGSLSIGTIKEYLHFLLNGPTIIFGSIILFLSFFKSKNRLKFFLVTFLINLFLGILSFYIATHNLVVPSSIRLNFDPPRIYSTLVGLFMIVLAFFYWLEWQIQGRKDKLLEALWLGPFIAFLFVILTWMLADISLGFGGPQDHYLLIPTFGISLFLAGLLMIIYNKMTRIKSIWLKLPLLVIICFLIFSFHHFNKQMIYAYFNAVNSEGRAAKGQQMIQSKFRQILKKLDFDYTKVALFYFDTTELHGDGRFWTESFLSSFPFWMHFQGNQLTDGCVEVFYEDKNKLAKLVQDRNGKMGFVYRGLCVEKGKGGYKEIFYKPENFYAFQLKNRDFIDIKEETLKELGF